MSVLLSAPDRCLRMCLAVWTFTKYTNGNIYERETEGNLLPFKWPESVSSCLDRSLHRQYAKISRSEEFHFNDSLN